MERESYDEKREQAEALLPSSESTDRPESPQQMAESTTRAGLHPAIYILYVQWALA